MSNMPNSSFSEGEDEEERGMQSKNPAAVEKCALDF